MWFLAVGRPGHPAVRKWRHALATYWHGRAVAGGAAMDPFFAHVGLGPGSAVPTWGEAVSFSF